jgi:hypothetical protein
MNAALGERIDLLEHPRRQAGHPRAAPGRTRPQRPGRRCSWRAPC